MNFDFSEVFTVAARHVVPLARSQGLSFAFDCQVGHRRLQTDPLAMQGALHRLFLEVLALLRSGSSMISAVDASNHERHRIHVHIAGVGALASDEALAEARERLLLSLTSSPNDKATSARGLCPHTGGAVELSAVAGQGILVTLELTPLEVSFDDAEHPHSAQNARAWLVNVDDVLAASWTKRLQRLGWAVTRIPSAQAAARQLRDAPQAARPALVIALETPDPVKDGTLDLPALLPHWTRLVYAVATGSATLHHPASVTGYEVHVYPMTPEQLERFTDECGAAEFGSGTTVPIPLTTHDMLSVLIVDDTPLNLIVGRGFAEALGYHVRTAVDGLDAIESCRQQPPDVVLMDLHMPRLGGIETVRNVRELQRRGDMPPFPIVVLTAGWSPEVRAQCMDAGADECLAKPLSLPDMAQELSRVSSYR